MNTYPLDSLFAPFPNIRKGIFVKRKNRFVIECMVGDNRISAYLPNPGRLWELLTPGRTIYLAHNDDSSIRKNFYTAVAADRRNSPILLHTHVANRVVQWLLTKKMIPDFEDAYIEKPEIKVKNSRFDFLLKKDNKPFLLEVKSCTLFGNQLAMFPDAVTSRGQRHLRELAEHTKKGIPSGVLFLVNWPQAHYFLPDFHTDPTFAKTLLEVKDILTIKAISIGWTDSLSLTPHIHELSIPWHLLRQEMNDRGSYILIFYIPKDMSITIGSQGFVPFRKGYYLYVDSAKTGLRKRIERYRYKKKIIQSHIDVLRNHAQSCQALAIQSSTELKHDIATSIEKIADWLIPLSDSANGSYCFGMLTYPLYNPKFIDILQHFRIDLLEKHLSAM